MSSKWANEVNWNGLFPDRIHALYMFENSACYFADFCIAPFCLKKKLWWVLQFGCSICLCKALSLYIYIYIYIYRVSQEECAILREGVP